MCVEDIEGTEEEGAEVTWVYWVLVIMVVGLCLCLFGLGWFCGTTWMQDRYAGKEE